MLMIKLRKPFFWVFVSTSVVSVAPVTQAEEEKQAGNSGLVIDDEAPLSIDGLRALEATVVSARSSNQSERGGTGPRPPGAVAVERAVPLSEIEIESARSDDPWLSLPYTVYVVSESTLERRQVRNLTEALDRIPGVNVQKTANGQGSPYIRGFTGYRTLAVIDGVRYNNSVYRDGPSEYFSLIDSGAISTIELLQGPGSVFYGSDAIGGTLFLHTRSSDFTSREKGLQFLDGSGSYRWSSAEQSHLRRWEVDTGVGDEWGLHLGFSRKHFGNVIGAGIGEQRFTGYDEWAYDLRFDARLGDWWTLTAAHQNLDQDDVWRTHSTQFAIPFAGTKIGSDRRRLKDQQRTLTYLKLRGEDLDGFIDTATITASFQNWQEDGERIRKDGRSLIESFDSGMWGIDFQFQSETRLGTFTYGIDFYQDNVDTARSDFNADGSLNEIRIQGPVGDDAEFSQLGVYLQDEFEITDRLTAVLGGRYTSVGADIGRYEDPASGAAASFSDRYENVVGSMRLTYDLDEEGERTVFAGVSQSFRAPNLADLSRFGGSRSDEIESAAIGLRPEEFLTYELGFKTATGPLTLSGSVYYTAISDFITSTPTGRISDGLREVTKQNSSNGYVQGAEVFAEYEVPRGFTLFGHLASVEGEADLFPFSGSRQAVREPLSRIQPVIGGGGLRWEQPNGRWWCELSVLVAAKADRLNRNDVTDTQRIPPGGTPGYTRMNLNSEFRYDESTTFFFGVNNLLDEAYRSHGSGSNEPGLGTVLGVKKTF